MKAETRDMTGNSCGRRLSTLSWWFIGGCPKRDNLHEHCGAVSSEDTGVKAAGPAILS